MEMIAMRLRELGDGHPAVRIARSGAGNAGNGL
jgi:hypothetical protein